MLEAVEGNIHQRLCALLDEHRARYRVMAHEAVGQCEAVSAIRGTALGQGAKALVCKVKGNGVNQHVLAILAADRYMFDTTLLILLGLAALGFISHNTTVAISILVLIIVRVTPLNAFFPWVEKQGLTVGIIILTIGVMAPIASGTLPPSTLIHSFMNWKSLLAIAVGVFVSWLGGRGVSLMGSQPHLVAGLLVGTVLGVALFRGVPVGPLIAAGIISLFIGKS